MGRELEHLYFSTYLVGDMKFSPKPWGEGADVKNVEKKYGNPPIPPGVNKDNSIHDQNA